METKIRALMLQARKEKNAAALKTYQAILDGITAKDSKGQTPNEGDQIKVLKKMVTSREDVAKVYTDQNRQDLADIELYEANIIKQFIPAPMDAGEATVFIVEYIKNSGIELVKRNMGNIVKAVGEASGGRIDGKLASGIVVKLIDAVK